MSRGVLKSTWTPQWRQTYADWHLGDSRIHIWCRLSTKLECSPVHIPWRTRHTCRVTNAFQIRLHPNTLSILRRIDILESWMSTIRRHTKQTKTSTVSARPTIKQPANLPPITEQHQRDQPGSPSLLTRPITEFQSRQYHLLHCGNNDQSCRLPPHSAQQKWPITGQQSA